MPFKSAKQEAWMFANHPEIAKKWAVEHPKNAIDKLKNPQAPKPPKFSGWMGKK